VVRACNAADPRRDVCEPSSDVEHDGAVLERRQDRLERGGRRTEAAEESVGARDVVDRSRADRGIDRRIVENLDAATASRGQQRQVTALRLN
jgi:hypothetical protein